MLQLVDMVVKCRQDCQNMMEVSQKKSGKEWCQILMILLLTHLYLCGVRAESDNVLNFSTCACQQELGLR